MLSFSETELILNPDGSIYHLALRPEDIAPVVITVGDPGRVAEVSKYFDRIDLKKGKREFITHTGWLGNKRITVLSSGIGPDNIDIVVNEADALVNIDFETRRPRREPTELNILRLGTSGSIQEDIPVDSVVVSSYGIGLDNLLWYYHHPHSLPEAELTDALYRFLEYVPALPTKPYLFSGSTALLSTLGKSYHQGITLTCPGFYGPQGRFLRAPSILLPETLHLLANFQHQTNRIINFEMETSAIYGLARILGHRALSFNAILANRRTMEFSTDPHRAVDRMIRRVLETIALSEEL